MKRRALFVVDDDKILGRIITRRFSSEYNVTLETSGKRAVAIGESDAEFDLVLLDLMLPDMSGQSVCEQWQRSAPARLGRTVIMTGYGDDPAVAPWAESHGLEILCKPFDPVRFEELISRYCALDLPRGPGKRMSTGSGSGSDAIEQNGNPQPKPAQHDPIRYTTASARSSESLPNLDFSEEDVDTDVIDLALARGAPPEVVAELRIRRLHKSHAALTASVDRVKFDVSSLRGDVMAVKTVMTEVKGDVSSIKTSVDDLKTYRTQADASLKTTIKIAGGIVGAAVLVGVAIDFVKVFILHH